MNRVYTNVNVYEASLERIAFIFKNFKRIYVSFSGGKDSGVMLNLVIDFMRKNKIKQKIGVMVLDNEANYTYSLNFMHDILESNSDLLDVYWCCLPITLPCTVSSFMIEWQCWGREDESRWIRPIPTNSYVISMDNVYKKGMTFFRENMNYDDFWDEFGNWFSKGNRCACLIGIRTSESLNRFRAIMNKDKETLLGQMWTKRNSEYVYNCYPIYDWKTEDIWIANGTFDWKYNELYDIFWKAGLSIYQMRVASPFMSESKSSLNMYRVIDPLVWARLCARVQGANFVATYGKQLTYRSFKLPEGHTWKSFVKFLLKTLPKEVARNFNNRFIQSILFWGRVGRGLSNNIVKDLRKNGIHYKLNGKTPHGSGMLDRIRIQSVPDHCDFLRAHPSTVISWKRFAITILKNDHTCKYLGLQPSKSQMERQREIVKKYKNIDKKLKM